MSAEQETGKSEPNPPKSFTQEEADLLAAFETIFGEVDNGKSEIASLLDELIERETAEESNSKIQPDLLEEIKEKHRSGEDLEALLVLSKTLRTGATPSNPNSPLRLARKRVVAALTPDVSEINRREKSHAFELGRHFHAAHQSTLRASIYASGLASLSSEPIELVTNSQGKVSEMIIGEIMPATPTQDRFETIQQVGLNPEESATTVVYVHHEPKPTDNRFRIQFEQPLPAPNTIPQNQSEMIDYAIQVIKDSLAELGEVPRRPYDVAKALGNETKRVPLLKALEAGHLIFGDREGISLIDKNEVARRGEISSDQLDEFTVINWLSLIRFAVNNHRPTPENQSLNGKGYLEELPLGDIKFLYVDKEGRDQTIDIRGGRLDYVLFDWESDHRPDKPRQNPLAAQVYQVQDKFPSQRGLYHRHRVGPDGEMIKTKTRLGKSLRSTLQDAWHDLRGELFERLRAKVVDLKYPAGDSTEWDMVYSSEFLPSRKYQEKMREYLFLTIAQLYWTLLWSENESESFTDPGENFAIEIDEIVAFAREYHLLERKAIGGENRYQLPEREVVMPVGFLDYEDLKACGQDLLNRRKAAKKTATLLRAYRTVALAARGRIEEIKEIVPEIETLELPEFLEGFCVPNKHRPQLCLVDLAQCMFQERDQQIIQEPGSLRVQKSATAATLEKEPILELKPGLSVNQAIEFKQEQVFVIWVNGIAPDRQELRIAIDIKTNRFSISGASEDLIIGGLLSARQMERVVERPGDIENAFSAQIWQPLQEGDLAQSTPDWAGKDFEYDWDGEKQPVTNTHRPITYKWDPVTDSKTIVPSLVQAAHDVHGDEYDMDLLAEYLKERPEGQNLYCPGRVHNDTKKRSAGFYPNGIKCFACGEFFAVPSQKTSMRVTRLSGALPEHWLQPGLERMEAFRAALAVGQAFGRNSSELKEYLKEARGLNPESLGPHGYVPMELAAALYEMTVDTSGKKPKPRKSFKEITDNPHGKELRLDTLAKGTNFLIWQTGDGEALIKPARKIIELIDKLPHEDRLIVLDNLKLGMIKKMRKMGIISRSKKEGWLRWGGRVFAPAYWIDGNNLIESNFNARGVESKGQKLFEGQDHLKAPFGRPNKDQRKRGIKGMPAGFHLCVEPEEFLDQVEKDKEIVVTEGFLNSGTLVEIDPKLRGKIVTNLGTGHRALMTLIRWLGAEGDVKEYGKGRQFGVKVIYLCHDFDEGGWLNYWKTKEKIEDSFTGVEVRSVHGLLPPEAIDLLPDFFRDSMPPSGKETQKELFKNEGAPWHKRSLDLNDLWRMLQGKMEPVRV